MNSEIIIQNLLTGREKDREEAMAVLCQLSSPQQMRSLEDRVELLKNCGSAPRQLLTKIVLANIFSPIEEIRNICIQHLRNKLSRPDRQLILRQLLDGEEADRLLAIQLAHEWGVQTYGDLLRPLLGTGHSLILQNVVKALSHISISTYLKDMLPLFGSGDDAVRLCLAKQIATPRQGRMPNKALEACLKDKLVAVRIMGLTAIQHDGPNRWIQHLIRHLAVVGNAEENGETVKLLGETGSPKVIDPLLEHLFKTVDQGVRWSCIQALDQIGETHRLKAYGKALKSSPPERIPLIYELAGYCHSRECLLFLRSALKRETDPGLRGLIASAIGTCGHLEGEQDLLQMMEGDLIEAYAASAALKGLVKGRIMDHLENFLRRADIDPLIKQILIQHISDNAQTVSISESLRVLMEDMLTYDNENIRYLSLIALGNMASPKSLPILIGLTTTQWTQTFLEELNTSIESCCQGSITPLLALISSAPTQQRLLLQNFLVGHPMTLSEQDLELLSREEAFRDWNWDEELLPCIQKTQEKDRTFIWKQFSRMDLSDKLCCFLARGFDQSQPKERDLLDPNILIQCFARFRSEKPLLLLGKLMSLFPRLEFLPPLIQYSESVDTELQPMFKSYVRKIIHGMGTGEV